MKARRILRTAGACALAALVAACMAERPQLGPPVISPTRLGTLGPAPVTGKAAHFAFAQVTSIPGEFAYALDDDLKNAAAERGLIMVAEGDPTTTYWVKGYLSAIGDMNGITLVYVWDVFDSAGQRLRRFTGQLPAPGKGADPWSGVSKDMIKTAARETIDALSEWARG
jgi:hypothetical protein